MTLWQKYHLAESISDALQALAHAAGPARLVAGGSDLLLDMQQGRHPPVHTLVDITRIPELCRLEIRRGALFIGAAVALSRVTASALVGVHAQALQEASGLIGGPQVRNSATLGGNVSHALPAGDGAIALLALDARAQVASLEGERTLPLSALYRGAGQSALDPQRDLLVGFHLPLRLGEQGSAFRRVMRPQGVAIAILNMAAWLERAGGRIHDVRIAVGPAGTTPLRATAAEERLRGRELDEQAVDDALDALLNQARFRTSLHRATQEYRREMAGVLLRDVLRQAWQRAALTLG
ncbi:MAG: FAD binding domain-containing protein [Chloroflexi bacterium]|nr:FAD binding domain-containing protein [Chloroflexota bacterium]